MLTSPKAIEPFQIARPGIWVCGARRAPEEAREGSCRDGPSRTRLPAGSGPQFAFRLEPVVEVVARLSAAAEKTVVRRFGDLIVRRLDRAVAGDPRIVRLAQGCGGAVAAGGLRAATAGGRRG